MPIAIQVTIPDLSKFQDALKKAPAITRREVNQCIKRSAEILWAKSGQEAPRDTNALVRSITTDYGDMEATIYPTVDYAGYVHDGTGPSPGRYVPAIGVRIKSGMHPGQKANPFMQRALDQSRSRIEKIFEEVLTRITEQI